MIPEQWCFSLFVPINPSNETALSVSEVFVFLGLNFPALKDKDAEPLKPTTLGSDLMVQCFRVFAESLCLVLSNHIHNLP